MWTAVKQELYLAVRNIIRHFCTSAWPTLTKMIKKYCWEIYPHYKKDKHTYCMRQNTSAQLWHIVRGVLMRHFLLEMQRRWAKCENVMINSIWSSLFRQHPSESALLYRCKTNIKSCTLYSAFMPLIWNTFVQKTLNFAVFLAEYHTK